MDVHVMDPEESDICIVVLVGIPASGKTTFAKFLMAKSSNLNVSGVIGQRNYNIVHICYDDLIPLISLQEGTWRESRKKIVMVVANIIQLAKERKYSDVEKYLTELKITSCKKKNFQSESETLIIIIDDNMYYRSMRYEYFKLARTYATSFAEICIHCTVDRACVRNSQRSEGRVPHDVIIEMASKICCPDTNKTSWEKWFCCIYSCGLFNNDVAQTAFKVIEMSIRQPVPPVTYKDNNNQEKCVPNLIHEADIALRRVVSGKVIQLANKGKGDADHLQPIMLKKQVLLKDLKDGCIQVPDYVLKLFDDCSNELQNELQLWWLDQFDDNNLSNSQSLKV